jgi:acyl-CoA synthetase (AMP-forming)/AMP-acid ligase II
MTDSRPTDMGAHAVRGDLEFGTNPRLVETAAQRWPDAAAIVDVDAGVARTFAEFAADVLEAARAFAASGVAPGDRVAIWAPNIWEWPVAALGAQAAGGVLVPLNTRFKGAEAAYVLRRSGAKALVTVDGFLDNNYVAMLRKAVADEPLTELATIVVARGDAPAETLDWRSFFDRAAGTDIDAARAKAHAVKPDDLADMLFTSGTTGHPKGVRTTHAQNLRAFRSWADVVGLRAGDRYLIVNPFFHTFGFKAGILASFMSGSTLYPHAVFDAGQVLERIPRDRISMLPGPPALFQTILARDDLDRFDLSSLRLSVTGAAPITASMIEAMRGRLGFENVVTGYGLTETCGIATMCRYDDDDETIAGTSGRAIDGVDVLVVDDDGKEVERDTPGEIVVRGYNVMLGYFDDEAETKATIDADGWLHTGDIGTMDARGYIKITDRKKDMFIVGGFNAYPAEIEGLLARHPDIAQTAVIGVPDDRLGEVGHAYVILRAGAPDTTPADIVAWCRDEMANYKVPRTVEIVTELPLNASGKVLKYELRDRAADS